MKQLTDLKKGESFIARVTDIRPDSVTIQLPNGGLISVKSIVLPNARIGEDAVFIVKENIKGKIKLEMTMVGADAENEVIGGELKKHRYFDMRV